MRELRCDAVLIIAGSLRTCMFAMFAGHCGLAALLCCYSCVLNLVYVQCELVKVVRSFLSNLTAVWCSMSDVCVCVCALVYGFGVGRGVRGEELVCLVRGSL